MIVDLLISVVFYVYIIDSTKQDGGKPLPKCEKKCESNVARLTPLFSLE